MKKNQVRPKPRKLPTQQRSRVTVDAIIQASTYILIESGWEGFTTNAIAERAGVNISSLYQFFENKESIIAEIQRRHAESSRSALQMALQTLPEDPSLNEILTILIQVVVEEHKAAPTVHKVLYEEIPQTVRCVLDDEITLRENLMDALRPLMVNVPDPDLAMYIVGVTADSLINQVTASRPNLLSEQQFITEIVTLLSRYLIRDD